MNINSTLAIVLTLLLTACATPTKYFPLNIWGEGYTETQVATNIFRVSFHANDATRADYAEDMTLLRSAEVTKNNGYSYFIIVNEASRSDGMESHGGGVVSGFKTSPTSSFGSIAGSSSTSSKPSTTNTLVCYKSKPENSSGLVYDATFIINSIENKYHISNEAERNTDRDKRYDIN
jgi:hypothetical protein